MSEDKSQVARAELDIPSWILFKEKKKIRNDNEGSRERIIFSQQRSTWEGPVLDLSEQW